MFNLLRELPFFKPESVTRSLLPDDPVFTETEEKLIRLGLNSAAHQGESDACAVKLFQSLRRRGVSAEQLVASMTQSTWAVRELMAARGYIVQGGKFQGKTVGELPMWYLEMGYQEPSRHELQPAAGDADHLQ
jgi:hypothetical protein